MLNIFKLFISILIVAAIHVGCSESPRHPVYHQIVSDISQPTIDKAERYLDEEPETVVRDYCGRSAGGRHDFYSEGDYWWPDPDNPGGPYIRRDGLSNPEVFSEHRHAMVRFSEITATLTSAWLLTGNRIYADKAIDHLNAWFVDPETLMNPNLLYAQAISGRVTGRGIGLIDAYHLVEVAQSVRVLAERNMFPVDQEEGIMDWFGRFLTWMTTHEYGIDEMNTRNNHAVCWLATAGVMARLTENREIIDLCVDRFKNIVLPDQMGSDGSFPRELDRTKPYGYALFNIDAFANVAQILSTPEDNLWEFETPDGRSLKLGMEFIFPYIKEKSSWPHGKDVYIWEEWPVRQSSLLFSGLAYNSPEYIDMYLSLPADPDHPEVIRNLPVRYPVIWIDYDNFDKQED